MEPSNHTQSVKVPPLSMAILRDGRGGMSFGWLQDESPVNQQTGDFNTLHIVSPAECWIVAVYTKRIFLALPFWKAVIFCILQPSCLLKTIPSPIFAHPKSL